MMCYVSVFYSHKTFLEVADKLISTGEPQEVRMYVLCTAAYVRFNFRQAIMIFANHYV